MSGSKTATLPCLGKNPSPQAFAKYAKKHDIFLHPDVAFLVPTKTMGMGVFAARPLPAGTVVISCPEASGISPYMKDVSTSPSVQVLHGCPAAMEDAALFDVLVLMSELCRPQSTWRPWLETCPRMDHHLFDLTADQAAALGVPEAESGSECRSSAEKDNAGSWLQRGLGSITGVSQALEELHVSRRWHAAQQIMAAAPDVWPSDKATFTLFCDCMAQVFSRNFHREELAGREGPYLLPGLDILNHSFTANTTFEVRGGGRKHATAFTVVTTRAVQKGEQVYGCYGRIGAARFAVEFQFVTKAVLRNDFVRVSAASLAIMATLLYYWEKQPASAAATSIAAYLYDEHERNDLADASSVRALRGAWEEELFGRDSLEAVQSIYRDMARRVEQLQRLGLLFDEGLYLVRPYATWAAEEAMEAAPTFRWGTPAEHAKEVAQQTRLLAATVCLLTAPKLQYDELYHHITAEWEPPQTKAAALAVRRFVDIKVVAAQRQQASLAQAFRGSEERDAVRRQLIHDTLMSEISTLRYYADNAAARNDLGE